MGFYFSKCRDPPPFLCILPSLKIDHRHYTSKVFPTYHPIYLWVFIFGVAEKKIFSKTGVYNAYNYVVIRTRRVLVLRVLVLRALPHMPRLLRVSPYMYVGPR